MHPQQGGSGAWGSGFFFKAVVQSLLLFGADTWVFPPRMGKALGGFQTQVARRMTGQLPRRKTDGKWRYTSEAAARDEVQFLTMEVYVRRRHDTVTQYVVT